jgi:hypothetical protein
LEMNNGGVNAIRNRALDISILENKFGVINDNFTRNLEATIEWYGKNKSIART